MYCPEKKEVNTAGFYQSHPLHLVTHGNVPLSGSIRFERGAPTLRLFNDEVGEAINSDMKVAFPQPHTRVFMHFK